MKSAVKKLVRLYVCAVLLVVFLAGIYGFAAPALASADDTLLCLAGGVLAVGVGPAVCAFGIGYIAKLWRKVSQ